MQRRGPLRISSATQILVGTRIWSCPRLATQSADWVPRSVFSNPPAFAQNRIGQCSCIDLIILRRRGDSNSREPFDSATFPRWCTRPLCDASVVSVIAQCEHGLIVSDESLDAFSNRWVGSEEICYPRRFNSSERITYEKVCSSG